MAKNNESNTSEVLEELKVMNQSLEEILKWTKVRSIPHVKKLLEDTISSDSKKTLAYSYSDGKKGSQEIEKMVGAGYVTITNWWKIWMKLGIAEPVNVQGGERCKHIFDLEDFGIEIPKEKKSNKALKIQNAKGGQNG